MHISPEWKHQRNALRLKNELSLDIWNVILSWERQVTTFQWHSQKKKKGKENSFPLAFQIIRI